MIGFVNSLNYLEVGFQICYYFVYFCLVNSGLFSCNDKKNYLVFCTLVLFLVILLFLSTFGNALSVSSAIFTPFFEKGFTIKSRIFLIDV